MPQLCGQVIICCFDLGESCISCWYIQSEICGVILNFAMIGIVGTSIACHSSRLFELFSVQAGLIKVFLGPHTCAIIGGDTLAHAICMCILLRHQNFWDAHLCELLIRKLWVPRYCECLSSLYLVKQDIGGVFDVICCLYLFLIYHEVSWSYLSILHGHPVHQLYDGLVCVTHRRVFFSLDTLSIESRNDDFFRALVMFFTG